MRGPGLAVPVHARSGPGLDVGSPALNVSIALSWRIHAGWTTHPGGRDACHDPGVSAADARCACRRCRLPSAYAAPSIFDPDGRVYQNGNNDDDDDDGDDDDDNDNNDDESDNEGEDNDNDDVECFLNLNDNEPVPCDFDDNDNDDVYTPPTTATAPRAAAAPRAGAASARCHPERAQQLLQRPVRPAMSSSTLEGGNVTLRVVNAGWVPARLG